MINQLIRVLLLLQTIVDGHNYCTIVWSYFITKIFVGTGTYENLLHEKSLTQIITKFLFTHLTLEYVNFKIARFIIYFYCFFSN